MGSVSGFESNLNAYFDGKMSYDELKENSHEFENHELMFAIESRETARQIVANLKEDDTPVPQALVNQCLGYQPEDDRFFEIVEDVLTLNNIRSGPHQEVYGFKNFGNTCFMNSLLKVMMHSKLGRWLGGLSLRPREGESVESYSVRTHLHECYKHLHTEYQKETPDQTVINRNLKEISQSSYFTDRGMEIGSQHDPHELMSHLIEAFDFKDPRATFGINSQYQASDGRTEIINDGRSPILSLRFHEGDLSTQSLIDYTLFPELMDDRNNVHNRFGLNAVKTLFLTGNPESFTLQLARYSYSEEGALKDLRPVMGITEPVELPISTGITVRMQPQSIICHSGASVNSGHYVTLVRKEDDSWELHNDGQVSIPSENLLHYYLQNAYMVHYERV